MSTNPTPLQPVDRRPVAVAVVLGLVTLVALAAAVAHWARPHEPVKPAHVKVPYEVMFERDGGAWRRGSAESVPQLGANSTFVMKVIPQVAVRGGQPVVLELMWAGKVTPFPGEPEQSPDGVVVVRGRVGRELSNEPGLVTLIVKVAGRVAGRQALYVRR